MINADEIETSQYRPLKFAYQIPITFYLSD